MIRLGLALGMLGASACAAHAVAVIDNFNLSEKTDTKTKTIKLVPIQSGTKDTTDGIKCAVTTGQQGKVSDPAKPADTAAGRAKVQAYGPDLPTNWTPPTTGSTANRQEATGNFGRNQAISTASDVVGGQIGSEQTVTATRQVYTQQAGEIGSAKTIQGSWDQNSGVRVQNALTWNQSTNALNLLVQAMNLANMMRTNSASRAATAQGITTGIGATVAGKPITCGTNQVANPYAGLVGMPNCLDLAGSSAGSADSYLALLQAAAQAAALVQATGK